MVGPIFGPTHIWFKPILGRGHIWSNQIWSVPYLVQPDLVCAEFGAGVRQPLARGPYHKEALFTKILSTYLAELVPKDGQLDGPNMAPTKSGWTKYGTDQIWLDQKWPQLDQIWSDQKWLTKSVSTKSGLTPLLQKSTFLDQTLML